MKIQLSSSHNSQRDLTIEELIATLDDIQSRSDLSEFARIIGVDLGHEGSYSRQYVTRKFEAFDSLTKSIVEIGANDLRSLLSSLPEY